MLYICVKFHQNIWNGFQFTAWTQVQGRNGYALLQRAIIPKVDKPELQFMCPACRLIVLYICVKFRRKYLRWYQSYGVDMNDGSADGQTLKILDGIT